MGRRDNADSLAASLQITVTREMVGGFCGKNPPASSSEMKNVRPHHNAMTALRQFGRKSGCQLGKLPQTAMISVRHSANFMTPIKSATILSAK